MYKRKAEKGSLQCGKEPALTDNTISILSPFPCTFLSSLDVHFSHSTKNHWAATLSETAPPEDTQRADRTSHFHRITGAQVTGLFLWSLLWGPDGHDHHHGPHLVCTFKCIWLSSRETWYQETSVKRLKYKFRIFFLSLQKLPVRWFLKVLANPRNQR